MYIHLYLYLLDVYTFVSHSNDVYDNNVDDSFYFRNIFMHAESAVDRY